MSCDNIRQVHAYHDGELPLIERARVEAHLRGCGDCAALLAELRRMSQLVAAARVADMPQDAMHRLEQSFWAARARDRGVLRLAEWMTGVAAAVLIGAAGLWERGTRAGAPPPCGPPTGPSGAPAGTRPGAPLPPGCRSVPRPT